MDRIRRQSYELGQCTEDLSFHFVRTMHFNTGWVTHLGLHGSLNGAAVQRASLTPTHLRYGPQKCALKIPSTSWLVRVTRECNGVVNALTLGPECSWTLARDVRIRGLLTSFPFVQATRPECSWTSALEL
eukprot:1159239-Pelagomonas_calceolata.AAC.3